MPRRARLSLPNVPLHLIQRGNNRQACFFADEDYCFYLDWLRDYAGKTSCRIHAYVLMTNHVHVLVSAVRPAPSSIKIPKKARSLEGQMIAHQEVPQ